MLQIEYATLKSQSYLIFKCVAIHSAGKASHTIYNDTRHGHDGFSHDWYNCTGQGAPDGIIRHLRHLMCQSLHRGLTEIDSHKHAYDTSSLSFPAFSGAQDELLVACLELILSSPPALLTPKESTQRSQHQQMPAGLATSGAAGCLLSSLCLALPVGLHHVPIATLIVQTLERWEDERPLELRVRHQLQCTVWLQN